MPRLKRQSVSQKNRLMRSLMRSKRARDETGDGHGDGPGVGSRKANEVGDDPTGLISTAHWKTINGGTQTQNRETSTMKDNIVLSVGAADHNTFVMKNLQEQFVEGKNCDLEVRLKDSKIFVHKCLADTFFTRIGAELDLENDMFYLDLKKYPRRMMTPLIDMMYHGNLSVKNTFHHVKELLRVSSVIGFIQAKDLLKKHEQTFYNDDDQDNQAAKADDNGGEEAPEFVIKSEPVDEDEESVAASQMANLGTDVASNTDEAANAASSTATRKNYHEEISKNLYIVYTPKGGKETDSEILPSRKFKENSKKINDLIKDHEKTEAIVTDQPYQTVKQIIERNTAAIPQPSKKRKKRVETPDASADSEEMFPTKIIKTEITDESSEEDIEEYLREKSMTGTKKGQNNMNSLKPINSISAPADDIFGTQTPVSPFLKIGAPTTRVVHTQSPGPVAPNRPIGDYNNTQNFKQAAANRMLQKEIITELATKALKKEVSDNEANTVNSIMENNGKQIKINFRGSRVPSYFSPDSESYQDDEVNIGKSPVGMKSNTGPQASTSAEINTSRQLLNELKSYKQKTSKRPHTDLQYDLDDSDNDIDKYLIGKKDAKYFPPAGIVPKGCKSSYAQSIFLKTKKVTETITNSKGEVMVVTKEIPIRNTIFNPKKQSEHGVAAVVVCHPTKPVVRF